MPTLRVEDSIFKINKHQMTPPPHNTVTLPRAQPRQGHGLPLVTEPVHGLRAPLHVLLRPRLRAPRRPAVRRALRALDPRQGQIIEQRYFGGLSLEETAEALGVSLATVKRELRFAHAWLATELKATSSTSRKGT